MRKAIGKEKTTAVCAANVVRTKNQSDRTNNNMTIFFSNQEEHEGEDEEEGEDILSTYLCGLLDQQRQL